VHLYRRTVPVVMLPLSATTLLGDNAVKERKKIFMDVLVTALLDFTAGKVVLSTENTTIGSYDFDAQNSVFVSVETGFREESASLVYLAPSE